MKCKKMARYSEWSPTTERLPPPVRFVPKLSRAPKHGIRPLNEAPIEPGVWVVKLMGAYRPSPVEYRTAQDINDDFMIGVSFYWRCGDVCSNK